MGGPEHGGTNVELQPGLTGSWDTLPVVEVPTALVSLVAALFPSFSPDERLICLMHRHKDLWSVWAVIHVRVVPAIPTFVTLSSITYFSTANTAKDDANLSASLRYALRMVFSSAYRRTNGDQQVEGRVEERETLTAMIQTCIF